MKNGLYSWIDWVEISNEIAFLKFAEKNLNTRVLVITENDKCEIILLLSTGFFQGGHSIKVKLVSKLPEPVNLKGE